MINYNEQHIHLIVDGLKAADIAEGSAVDAHRMVAIGIHRLLGTLNGNGRALRSEIKARIESLGPSELHNDYAVRLCGREGDPKSQKAATNLRLAYLWMAEFPEQVDWVFLNTGACQPTSMHVSWKSHQSAIIKEGREAGSPPATIASRLPGTTPDVVKEVIDRAEKAEEKRKEKEQAQPEPAPETTPGPTMDIKAVIAGLDMATLAEALAQRPDAKLIADAMFQFAEMKAKAAEAKAAVKYTFIKSVGDLLSAIAPEVTTLALTKGNSSSKAATVRVSRRFSKVIVAVEGDHSTYDYSFKGKSLSVKMLKGFIMDAMMKHGTFPPEGGAEQISPSAGPMKHDAAFQLQLQA
jgi:hypothetical protein